MKKLHKYLVGSMLGMCCEYLYRVENTPIVWGIVLFIVVGIIIDLIDKET